MYKILKLILLLVCSDLCFANRILIESENCDFKQCFFPNENNIRNSSISYEELCIDIDYFCYYLKTAYIGYKTLLQNNFNESNLKDHFRKIYSQEENIDTKILLNELIDYMKPYITDGHFSINGTSGKENNYLLEKNIILYTNTFFEKINNEYILIETDSPKLLKGQKYTGNEAHLYYYPSKNRNAYRLGVISDRKPNIYSFSINNEEILLPVFDDGCISSSFGIKYSSFETEKTGYVRISSFLLPEKKSKFRKGAEIIFDKFIKLADKWNEKEFIILDLRCNFGGEMNNPQFFLYNLSTNELKTFDKKEFKKVDTFFEKYFTPKTSLDSPSVLQAVINFTNKYDVINSNYYKKIATTKLKQHKIQPKIERWKTDFNESLKNLPQYEGKLIFLIDRNTISAPELFIIYAKRIWGNENVIVIGENSYGSLEYGEIYEYLLPNSYIFLQLGSEQEDFLKDFSIWRGDGLGIFPDCWTTIEDINKSIYFYTNDEDLKLKNY